jgi:hypothetical protein
MFFMYHPIPFFHYITFVCQISNRCPITGSVYYAMRVAIIVVILSYSFYEQSLNNSWIIYSCTEYINLSLVILNSPTISADKSASGQELRQ